MSTSMPTALAGGRYQLGQLIGRGGMAEVHVALDTRLGRTVAVKIMRADLANDDIFLARFRREAHAVAQMNNPNIVNIYDSGERYCAVPTTPCDWVMVAAESSRARAMPKSMTLTTPCSEIMMLPGLISRWIMPMRCE